MDRPLEIPLAVKETAMVLATSTKGWRRFKRWRFKWHRMVFTLMDCWLFCITLPALSMAQSQQNQPHTPSHAGCVPTEWVAAVLTALVAALVYTVKGAKEDQKARLLYMEQIRQQDLEREKEMLKADLERAKAEIERAQSLKTIAAAIDGIPRKPAVS